MIQRTLFAATVLVLAASPVLAKVETKAMLSKSCSIEKVKQLAEGAAVRVVPSASGFPHQRLCGRLDEMKDRPNQFRNITLRMVDSHRLPGCCLD